WTLVLSRLPAFPTRRSSDLSQRQTGVATVRPAFHRESLSLKARVIRGIVAVGLMTGAFLAASPAAQAARPTIYVIPSNGIFGLRSEEHTSELQSRVDLVCRL